MIPGGRPSTLGDRLKSWWLNKLDNDSVRSWVPDYCATWLTWAILATFWLPPIQTICDAMSPAAYSVWVWLSIPANLMPVIGLKMRHGGSSVQAMTTPLLAADWFGLFLQAAGHALAHVLLVMFEVSVVIAAVTYDGPAVYAGMTIFAGAMLSPWMRGTLLLSAQCLRKVQKGLWLERAQLDGEVFG